MSLSAVSDSFLARRAASGDGGAFAELARRYRPLILHVTRGFTLGLEREDARQEALIGLFEACMHHHPTRGRFEGLASLRVRSRVRNARIQARGNKHRALSEAAHDGEEPTRQLAQRAAAGAGSDPAVVVELRDELRQRAALARRRQHAPGQDLRRRYSDQHIQLALSLIAEGKTLKQAAWAVGAPSSQIRRWVNRAGVARAGRRRFTPTEIREAVDLVHAGASHREAGIAIGASKAAVRRWASQAA